MTLDVIKEFGIIAEALAYHLEGKDTPEDLRERAALAADSVMIQVMDRAGVPDLLEKFEEIHEVLWSAGFGEIQLTVRWPGDSVRYGATYMIEDSVCASWVERV